MKWILIFYIAVTPGGGPESVDTIPGFEVVAFCTSKGSEE